MHWPHPCKFTENLSADSIGGSFQTELTGQLLADYVHPCDHKQLEMLTPDLADKSEDEEREVI